MDGITKGRERRISSDRQQINRALAKKGRYSRNTRVLEPSPFLHHPILLHFSSFISTWRQKPRILCTRTIPVVEEYMYIPFSLAHEVRVFGTPLEQLYR